MKSAPLYKLVIFDFDGTLADSRTWFGGIINEVASRYGFKEVSEADLEALRGQDNRAIIRHLGVPAWKMPLIAGHMRKLVARDLHLISLFPDAARTLLRLSQAGVKIAVVSSNAELNVRRILGPDLSRRIDHFECGASIFGKPRKLKAVLKKARVDAADAIAIGDEARDIDAAREASLACGAVSWGYATPELLQSKAPSMFFETFCAIAQLAAQPASKGAG